MRVERKPLFSLSMPYALTTFAWRGQTCVAAAPEDKGPVVVSAPPYHSAEVIVDGPGGCLALEPHPDRPGELFAIMGCFLGYQFAGGAVYRLRDEGGWKSERLADLPFGHRARVVGEPGARELLVTTLAKAKRDPADWSEPGALFSLPADGPGKTLTPVLGGIHKNHGLFLDGGGLWISGEEGLFHRATEARSFERVLGHEVSEMAVFDLGDGEPSLITIEPFHGPVLAVYRKRRGWEKVAEAELSYGHGLLADLVCGRPGILAANRSGNKDLLLFRWDGSRLRSTVIDAGAGAANMCLVHEGGRDLLFAACQAPGAFVRYALSEEAP